MEKAGKTPVTGVSLGYIMQPSADGKGSIHGERMIEWAIQKNDAGVSPVVAVMLLLIVVIIIASVVSAYAGSTAGSMKKPAKTAVIEAEYSETTGLLLTHKGGDIIPLKGCRIVLTLNGINFDMLNELDDYTLRPDKTIQWNGINTGQGTHSVIWIIPGKNPFANIAGKTGKLEIFDSQGLRIAVDSFEIMK
jgi:FlaG/FlaF family flagellin (archaellin)